MTTKPTTVRLDKEELDEIDNRCKTLQCNRNDFIKNAVKDALHNEIEQNNENQQNSEDKINNQTKIIGKKITYIVEI